jgi:hypothetical protein
MFTDTAGALNTGYHIKSTDRFNFWAQLVNYNKAPAKVYVTYDVEWVPGIVGCVSPSEVDMTLTATKPRGEDHRRQRDLRGRHDQDVAGRLHQHHQRQVLHHGGRPHPRRPWPHPR